eukprot:99992-Rhodomonas_salina.2
MHFLLASPRLGSRRVCKPFQAVVACRYKTAAVPQEATSAEQATVGAPQVLLMGFGQAFYLLLQGGTFPGELELQQEMSCVECDQHLGKMLLKLVHPRP